VDAEKLRDRQYLRLPFKTAFSHWEEKGSRCP